MVFCERTYRAIRIRCADIHANTLNKMTLPVTVLPGQVRCCSDIGTPVYPYAHIAMDASILSNMINVTTQEWFNVDRCYIPVYYASDIAGIF